jgi:hypothetical protein
MRSNLCMRPGCSPLNLGALGGVGSTPHPRTVRSTSLAPRCPPASAKRILINRFGAANVKSDWVTGGDEPAAGTVVFRDNPDRPFSMPGTTMPAKRETSWIEVESEGTRWRTPNAITVGMSLTALERANGRPFRMAEFSTEAQGPPVRESLSSSGPPL